MAKLPNPERVFSVISTILERKYEVKIDYALAEGLPVASFLPPKVAEKQQTERS